MNEQTIHTLGQDLFEAAERGVMIEPYSIAHPQVTDADAYRIQDVVVHKYVQKGYTPSGWKLGFTNPEMQKRLGVCVPSCGRLFDQKRLDSGATVPFSSFIQPGIEAEVLFTLGRDLPNRTVSAVEVLDATESVSAALEIVDMRQRRERKTRVDSIGDNASFGAYVVGPQKVDPRGLSLSAMQANVFKNGQPVAAGSGRAVMHNPLNSVVWLANELVRRGERLQAGDAVMTGSFVPLQAATAGDCFQAEFEALGSVTVTFVSAAPASPAGA